MRKSRSALVVLVALVLGLSFTTAAEDIPETPYDESDALPYEITPLFSILHQELIGARHLTPKSMFAAPFHPRFMRQRAISRTEPTPHPGCSSIVKLNHSLRC